MADAPARRSGRDAPARGKHEDELLALREENGALKRHNHEQEDKVRQLGVQMVRIREGLQNQATQNHTTPAHKARAVKELSQADRIAQLELVLAQRDAKEEKLAQQVTYYKQVAFSGAQPSGRGRPTKRQVRPSASARPASAAAMMAAAGGRPALASIHEMNPAGGMGDGGASAAADDRTSALMQMLQEKERQIVALQEREHHGPTASLLPAGASESAQLVELRRNLKDRTAKLTVLQQRYDHLNARFTTVRDNHEKVLSQMSELNRVIRDERTENTRLKQEMHSTAVMQDDLQERGAQLETLQSEKQALEDENRRLIAQAFSDAEANELSVTKQALAQRDSELKRFKQKMGQLEDRQKVHVEASTTTDTKLATAHVERDNAMRSAQKAQAELQLRLSDIEGLERRVALLVGDAGVAPEDLERALAMVRDAGRPTVAMGNTNPNVGSGLRLQDTDLNALGLSPLAKKQVQEILIQNSELIMQLEKTEQLLKIAQKMCAHRRRS